MYMFLTLLSFSHSAASCARVLLHSEMAERALPTISCARRKSHQGRTRRRKQRYGLQQLLSNLRIQLFPTIGLRCLFFPGPASSGSLSKSGVDVFVQASMPCVDHGEVGDWDASCLSMQVDKGKAIQHSARPESTARPAQTSSSISQWPSLINMSSLIPAQAICGSPQTSPLHSILAFYALAACISRLPASSCLASQSGRTASTDNRRTCLPLVRHRLPYLPSPLSHLHQVGNPGKDYTFDFALTFCLP